MSAVRTQVYLTPEQRERIDRLRADRGLSLAEVVREALDAYLDAVPDPEEGLASTFGALPNIVTPSRDEWDTRG